MHPFLENTQDEQCRLFREMEAYAKKYYIPIIRPETALELVRIVRETKPARILEIGAAIGYSSILMAHALDKKVFIQTVEILPERVMIARENIQKFGYGDQIQVIFGDGEDVMRSLQNRYDMIFLDGSKSQNLVLLSLCNHLLNPDGFVIIDNVLCQGMIYHDWLPRKKRTMVRKMQEMIHLLEKMRYQTTFISVGDGLVLASQS